MASANLSVKVDHAIISGAARALRERADYPDNDRDEPLYVEGYGDAMRRAADVLETVAAKIAPRQKDGSTT